MGASKTPISKASSYREIGEYWDKNDLSDHWDQTREVQIDVDIQSSSVYFAVEKALANKLRSAANDRGVSPESLLNQWLEEHVASKSSSK